MEKKISVVIPVYNVEKYITQCMDSLIKQTYNNLEIIVIDDESKDNSGEIADEFSKLDSRVIVRHIKNRGAAGARNAGLELVTGDYVLFVDSDDWLESDAISILVDKIEETNSDIVMCQYSDEYVSQSVEHSITDKTKIYDTEEAMREYIDHWEYPLIWNKIYKSNLLQDVRFVEGRCIDDEFFTYQLVAKAKKLVLVPDVLYHYRQRKSGAMGNPKKRRQRCQDQVDFVTKRYEDLKMKFPKLKNRLIEHMCEVYMTVMRSSGDLKEEYHNAKKHLWKYGTKALVKQIDINTKKAIIYYLFSKRVVQQSKVSTDDRFEMYK